MSIEPWVKSFATTGGFVKVSDGPLVLDSTFIVPQENTATAQIRVDGGTPADLVSGEFRLWGVDLSRVEVSAPSGATITVVAQSPVRR